MQTTSFILQNLGPVFAIGGNPVELKPLHISLFNWGGVNNNIHEVSDLFGYFLVSKKNYFKARLSALAESPIFEAEKAVFIGKQGGIKGLVLSAVETEWNQMKREDFLKYGVDTIMPYEMGNIEPDLGSENDPNFKWFGSKE
jgi:hypothetical protein